MLCGVIYMKTIFKNKNYKIKENGKLIIYGSVDMEEVYQKCLTLTNPPFWKKTINKLGNPIYEFQGIDLNPTIHVESKAVFSSNYGFAS